MAFSIDTTFQYWSLRFRNGPVGEFLRWWAGELKQALPQRWQQRLQRAMRRLTIRMDNHLILLGIDEAHTNSTLQTFELEADAGIQKRQLTSWLEQQELDEVPRFLLLESAGVLRKKLVLPIAAEANLRQVLSFEMDRQTPFRASDVYFDSKLIRSDKDTKQVHLELFVTPRKPIDSIREQLQTRGLTLSGVDIVDQNTTEGLNLLPIEQRHRVVNPRTRLNYGLAGALVVLLIIVMIQSLSLREGRVEKLEEAIAEVQGEARLVQRLREQVIETSEAASFLTRRRADSPMAIEILADVTRIIPDDTYLDRLLISPESVLIQGKSRNAQQLIEVVNKSEMLENAAFRGSTRLDASSGLEVFEVNADISAQGES